MGLRNRKILHFFKETKVSNLMDDEMKLWGPRRSRMKSEYVRGDSRGMPEMFVSSDQVFRNLLHTPFISHNFAWWMYFPKLKVSNPMGMGTFWVFSHSYVLRWQFASICSKNVVYILSCSENCNRWPCSGQLLALIRSWTWLPFTHISVFALFPGSRLCLP